MINVLEKHDEENDTVIASKPTSFEVRCLMNSPDPTKKQGVNIPNKTAIHFGINSSLISIYSDGSRKAASLENEIVKALITTIIMPKR
jgi:hypothetical protein